jgi:sec-independent protein translocase protein TatB
VFDFGFSEMVLIALIALIVLGPKRLPEVARSAGQWAGKLRRFVENVKRDIDAEIKDEDLAAFKQMHAELSETRNLLQKTASDTFSDFSAGLQQAGEPAAAPDEFTPLATLPAALDRPTAPARKPAARKPAQVRGKTAAKAVSAKAVARKSAATKPATKTHRTPHGGVKKT